MLLDTASIIKVMQDHADFSGVVHIREDSKTLFGAAYGYANRSDELPNTLDTRFAIASGNKLLTGVAICQLVEQGKLSFESRLQDIIDTPFPHFDPAITVHHLLSHTNGIPDYFDEDVMDDYGALWKERPNYSMTSPRDFLPMFQNLPMKFAPGERFHYNNAGYVLLGLIIESVAGQRYIDYVQQYILQLAGMNDSDFFALNQLPARTATGYLPMQSGQWRSNIFETPIIGGADGGIFVTAADFGRFWDALFQHRLLSADMTQKFLSPQAAFTWDSGAAGAYGYGIWIVPEGEAIQRYYAVGGDPGVAFVSTLYLKQKIEITVISNVDDGAGDVYNALKALI